MGIHTKVVKGRGISFILDLDKRISDMAEVYIG